ncbi:acyl-CoA dehydrogenase family protein [Ideonella sp. A 288]|uniref:acyl-CoA dehydrogenase family protein n=1 Tax=Ideonella sp. A 288 TaxID=1962181 RepID=UPI000B4B32C4|nr:acyl-CoA dehydrogenase family protein [Ideonella sp. A 288]
MPLSAFRHQRLPPEADALRAELRTFLAEALKDRPPLRRADSWMGVDPAFSRELGRRGWLGITLPRRYGGREDTAFARYVVSEELLAAGAPVSAHWIADRQSAPLILRFGTEAQRLAHLPAICRGERYFCIGMSEPDSGSDLASIRSTARRAPDGQGWVIDGHKLWTTNAHLSHFMIAVLRTGEPRGADGRPARHDGLSQFIVDLSTPGITVRPVRDLAGGHHFNEVHFGGVRLGDDALVGTAGQGWQQVNAELALERSGPERLLSSLALLHTLIDAVGRRPDSLQARDIGRLVARLFTLRQMSLAVTAEVAAGRDPAWAAACVKDLGSVFEQDVPELAQALLDEPPTVGGGSDHAQVLAALTQMAPSFSLRGGTREILRGIIARGLGLR